MIFGIQILGLLFALGMFYLTFIHYKRKEFRVNEFGMWTILWTAFALLSLFPSILDKIAETLHLVRTMDLLVILGFMMLAGLTFYNYIHQKKLKNKIEELVRKLALKEK